MKFLALKDALELALPAPTAPIEVPRDLPRYSPKIKRQTVVGGNVQRTPIDRVAARVVGKAPWWAMPPQPAVCKQPNQEPKIMSQTPTHENRPGRPTGIYKERLTEVEMNGEAAREIVRTATHSANRTEELLQKAMDARANLELMATTWRAEWIEFADASDKRLADLRIARMAFDTETKLLMASLREVRQFFLDKNHDQELARLKEFVETCERLERLKRTGFLDAVSDTMLKLA